jgi:prolyl-tRNA editing enzyme YbaK/EbsC (Cys-tRNA(Pro) deacylase)
MSSASAVLTSPSVERVRHALERAGIAADIVELPDTARLSALIGEPVAKADADFVRRHTGFAIGGVAPAGHGLAQAFVEKSLSAFDELWAAAGHPHTVFRLSFEQLLRVTNGVPAELAA